MSLLRSLGHNALRRRLEEEDFDKDITTVIKQTDDDSPNTMTTTIKPGKKSGNKSGMDPSQNALMNTLNGFINEMTAEAVVVVEMQSI